MHFLQSRLGALLGLVVASCLLVTTLAGVRVYVTTHPERVAAQAIDFEAMSVPVEPVRFAAVDGTPLAGWLLQGDPRRPPVLLCHDLGTDRSSLLHLAIELHGRGYTVLLFDFRGHGESGGQASTLGLHEKRDILGALDLLTERRGGPPPSVGLYGVGMGAHAAVLAARDRPNLRVLVLDGLYPDAAFPLARSVFARWDGGIRHLSFLPNGLFSIMYRTSIDQHRAADALPGLLGRDLLLLAPEGDGELMAEMRRMVESIPEQRDVDGNLVVLPATQGDGLYGDDLSLHREQVADFFDRRLTETRTARFDSRGS